MEKVKSLLLALLIILGVVLVLSPFKIGECAVNSKIVLSDPSDRDIASFKSDIKSINDTIAEEQIFKNKIKKYKEYEFITGKRNTSTKTYTISLKMPDYKKLEQVHKRRVMEICLETIKKSDASKTNRNKVYNFITEEDEEISRLVSQLSSDISADYVEAYSSFAPFSGWIGWILGILVIIIFVFLGLTITLDLAYLNLPLLQLALDKDDGQNKRPKLISIEAWNAKKMAENKAGERYVNAMGVYFSSKTKQFICLGVCLLYLMSGKIYVLVANCIDYFNGLLID